MGFLSWAVTLIVALLSIVRGDDEPEARLLLYKVGSAVLVLDSCRPYGTAKKHRANY